MSGHTNHNQQRPPTDAEKAIAHQTETGDVSALTGLSFDIPNIAPSYKTTVPQDPGSMRYVIRSAETIVEPVEHWQFSGVPVPYHHGGFWHFGRPPKRFTPQEQVQTYVVDKFNATGEMEDVFVCSQAELMELAKLANTVGRETGQAPEPVTAPNRPRVSVQLTGQEHDVFDTITGQLEKQEVFNWAGMSWKESADDGNDEYEIRVGGETLLNKRLGRTPQPTRSLVLKKYHEGELVSNQVLEGTAIRTYFNDRRGRLTNITAEAPDHQPAEASDKDMQTAKALADKAAISQEDEKEALTLMLSYADIIDNADRDAAEKMRANLHVFAASSEGKRRLKILKQLVDENGVAEVYLLAAQLRDQFMATSRALHIPTEFIDESGLTIGAKVDGSSVTWVLEALADRYYLDQNRGDIDRDYEGAALGSGFVRLSASGGKRIISTVRARRIQREVVDHRIGLALIGQTLHKKPVPKFVGIRDGQPQHEMDQQVLFDGSILERLPALTRPEVGIIEEQIYSDTKKRRPVRATDLSDLGRQLGRAVGR